LDTTRAGTFRNDLKVIGLVGSAHCLSHFFQLVLPPLFPLIKAEFGVSYATLGLLVGTFYVASGLCQFGAGFMVDRVGARPVLLGGVGLLAGGTLLAGFAPGMVWLFPIVALMGLGNGVFHPADFAILNSSVTSKRLGHAYSTHGVGGSLGYALAPVASYGLASVFDWHLALMIQGAVGLVVLGGFASQRQALASRVHAASEQHSLKGSAALLTQTPILLCFAYFALLTMATIGVQAFGVTALDKGYNIALALATSAITAYLLGNTCGILAGGFVAARTSQHHQVAMLGLLSAALFMIGVGAFPELATWAIPVFTLTGFSIGITGPSRDLIVKGATPRGASGRVYGFVYSGLDLGSTIGPVWLGFLLDHGSPHAVFFAIGGCMLASIATVLQVRRSVVAGRPAPAAD